MSGDSGDGGYTLWLPGVLTPLLNKVLRAHWRKRQAGTRALAWEVRAAIGRRGLPAVPIARARVRIVRRSALGPLPDQDGMIGGAKGLIDTLQPMDAKRRPYGLGLIAGDDQNCIVLEAEAVRVPKADVGTLIIITPLEEPA